MTAHEAKNKAEPRDHLWITRCVSRDGDSDLIEKGGFAARRERVAAATEQTGLGPGGLTVKGNGAHLQDGELGGSQHHHRPQGKDEDKTDEGADVAAGEDQETVPSTDCHTCRSASGCEGGLVERAPARTGAA